jgi:hypothetical protein
MTPELRQRIEAVHQAAQETIISLDASTDKLRQHAAEICERFKVPFGSLIRTSLAIKKLEEAKRLQLEYLQEAVQHLIIGSDEPSRYERS